MDIPLRIRNPFTPSDALDRHIQRCVNHAVRAHRTLGRQTSRFVKRRPERVRAEAGV